MRLRQEKNYIYDEKLKITQYEDIPKKVIKCSACNKPLCIVYTNQPSKKQNNLVIKCCYCGDKSFLETVFGEIYIAGFNKNFNGETYESEGYTELLDFDAEEDYTVVKVGKIKNPK